MNVRVRFTIIRNGRRCHALREGVAAGEEFANDNHGVGARSGQSMEHSQNEMTETRSNARSRSRSAGLRFPWNSRPATARCAGERILAGLSGRYGYAVDLAIHAPRDFPE